jgi:hypothetical protein
MKSFLIDSIFRMLRWYVSTGIFDRTAALVLMLTTEDIPGLDKRQKVIDFFKGEYGLIWGEATTIVLDAVIAITRLKVEDISDDG